jgi:DNA invertase Pin-like site-specific DNA recombinase
MTEHNGQRVGYQRVSTTEQNVNRQLEGVQVDRMFTDKVSGKSMNRPALKEMLAYVRAGDTVTCHSLDRMARNLTDLRQIVDGLVQRGVRVEFVKNGLEFSGQASSANTLLLNLLGSVAEFERDLILERQREGIAIAKAAGKYKGGLPKLKSEQVAALRLRVAGGLPIAKAAREFGVSRQTVYSALKGGGPEAESLS